MTQLHLRAMLQNLILFFPAFLSSTPLSPQDWWQALAGFGLLSLLSFVHLQVLTEGQGRRWIFWAAPLYAALLFLCWWLSPGFGMVAAFYVALALFNGYFGTRVVVVDILTISGALVLKGLAGSMLINAEFSAWAFICLFLAACTVAMGQRRNELIHASVFERQVLEEYTPKLLDQMLAVVTSSALVAYILYTLSEGGSTSDNRLLYTAFLVNFGLFRYLFLVYHRDMRCGAELAVIRDPQLSLSLLLWIGFLYGVYHVPQ